MSVEHKVMTSQYVGYIFLLLVTLIALIRLNFLFIPFSYYFCQCVLCHAGMAASVLVFMLLTVLSAAEGRS